jgi:hypothetical protein
MGYLLTRESARKANACYSDEQLAELLPIEGLSPRQVSSLNIPIDDRLWALCYANGQATQYDLDAAWNAARSAAWAAVISVAGAATRSADLAAAWNAAMNAQIDKLVEMLETP